MIEDLFRGLSTHIHGIPKWMEKMNPNKMSATQRSHILSMSNQNEAAAKKSCLETEKNGARCIF